MSRAYDRLIRKQEALDRARIERALELVEGDADLRFLLRSILEVCNMAADPFTGDPLTTAHKCGKMAVGTELVALLDMFVPDLYPALLKEMKDEQRHRNQQLVERLHDTGDD